jgi:hypothetical protein
VRSGYAVTARAVKRCASRRLAVVVVVAGVVAGAVAGPANAAGGFSLGLTGPSGAMLGKPVVLTAVGQNPDPTTYPYVTYLDVDLFAPGAVPTCPQTQDSAGQLAIATGGAVVDYLVQIPEDLSGNFSIPVGFTPEVSGPLLVCGSTAEA